MALHARSVREVIVSQSRPGRRTGAIMLVDELGRLSGIFTDSDLARLVAQTRDAELDRPIVHVMTRQPKTIVRGAAVEEALQILDEYRISELPVVDDEHRPLGLIDVTDMIGLSSGRRAAAQTLPFPDKAARSSSR
jgi:arabinose-5-phosphate isomerase